MICIDWRLFIRFSRCCRSTATCHRAQDTGTLHVLHRRRKPQIHSDLTEQKAQIHCFDTGFATTHSNYSLSMCFKGVSLF